MGVVGSGVRNVHTQHQPLFTAGHREFPDELQIGLRRVAAQVLKVDIDAVDPVEFRVRHDLCDQLPAHGRFFQERPQSDTVVKVLDQRPDLDPLLVGAVHIGSVRIAFVQPLVAPQRKPGRRDHREPRRIGSQPREIPVRVFVRHLVPAEEHRCLLRRRPAVVRCPEAAVVIRCLRFIKTGPPDVAGKAVRRHYPLPHLVRRAVRMFGNDPDFGAFGDLRDHVPFVGGPGPERRLSAHAAD